MIVEMSCTQSILKPQAARAVKTLAYKPIPFANCDLLRSNEFERLYKRSRAILCNGLNQVLHDFSLAVLEVRTPTQRYL